MTPEEIEQRTNDLAEEVIQLSLKYNMPVSEIVSYIQYWLSKQK